MNIITNTLPAAIGAAFGGGFFAGLINAGGKTFALIVSPKLFGEFKGRWHASDDSVPGAEDYADGLANTNAMAAAGSELAKAVRASVIEGFDDWYIPARDELELIYRNLKPTDYENSASFRDGENPSSVPMGRHYTEELPGQTGVDEFRAGGNQALDPVWHWSSTQYGPSSSYAWGQHFYGGYQTNFHKSYEGRARAVRRLPI
ncbi:DUF1566 domain-containing protein [Janthinobacterium sp. PAMC25594]|uniref:Lcl domain-containing protein n=1 Tax=Janthinobacterium sp. PAMC25594 TaxID=2861284 RepID=UPI001C639E5F|nr:DUF1566 domain-containing protein [Janthinobacterium sp. PAMC25594]QYG07153.1 DUF1566 domain-containing protein [Janthinobacterium sp. PAMC25594]